jgi:hypothetical protein
MTAELFRQLPSVDQLLQAPVAADLIATYGRPATLNALRETLERARQEYRSGREEPFSESALLAHV